MTVEEEGEVEMSLSIRGMSECRTTRSPPVTRLGDHNEGDGGEDDVDDGGGTGLVRSICAVKKRCSDPSTIEDYVALFVESRCLGQFSTVLVKTLLRQQNSSNRTTPSLTDRYRQMDWRGKISAQIEPTSPAPITNVIFSLTANLICGLQAGGDDAPTFRLR
ncbi:hypothetical protein GCK72_015903 [Caenorhabditis remanei]|uniref:Uncharacterized protein n=1 Tax=Caenorhabditis remanei TaxID=31234 RepID=A0A6A5GXS5_CAERE|nr:hypothetical protein GCK72_015903 [Caenorhabditis remanei]KAF1759436.1 hypothetical protein GCK72_015903 [Caenorhabditis remanei]